jgi:hypothetical protein
MDPRLGHLAFRSAAAMLRKLAQARPLAKLTRCPPYLLSGSPTCRRDILRSINYAAGIGATEEPDIDDAPVLRVVCQRASERARLLSEVRPSLVCTFSVIQEGLTSEA